MIASHYIKTAAFSALAYSGIAFGAANNQFVASTIDTMASSFTRLVEGPAPEATRGLHQVVGTASFTGASDHETRGTARIIKTDAGYELRLGSDFYLDGAPTPSVGFGRDGEFTTRVSDLYRKRGAQFYRLPEGFVPGDHTEVFIWCDDFSVPLGVARLDPATPAPVSVSPAI